jgi:hypothetical protein
VPWARRAPAIFRSRARPWHSSIDPGSLRPEGIRLGDPGRDPALAAAGWLARAEKKDDDALRLMRSAADLEDTTDKHP